MKIVGKRVSEYGAWAGILWIRCGLCRSMRGEVRDNTTLLHPGRVAVAADAITTSANKAMQ